MPTKTPFLLVGTALIFWGWQTGLWIFAVPMAVIVESSRLVPWRWELSGNDFKRTANLCLAILNFVFIYLLITSRSIYLIYTFLQWLPAIFFPLILAQAYSVNEGVDIRTLFLLFKSITKQEKSNRFAFNLTYPYFALCILSSSTVNSKNIYFYFGMCVLSAVALWFVRSKRFSPIIWLCLILISVNIGLKGHLGLHQLHLTLENRVVEWLSNTNGHEIDADKKQTDMGEIGFLKQSNDIVFRVASESQQTRPRLLREATYNKYQLSSWVALKPDFTPVQPDSNSASVDLSVGTTWRLAAKPATSSKIIVSATLLKGKGLLKLADGTFQIEQLPASKMERNQYGTIKVVGNEAISYHLLFNNNLSLDSPPTPEDLQIPNQEKPALNQIISQLDIKGKSPAEILLRVESFFLKNFRYSLKLIGKDNSATPLSKFLLQTRTGHCEYFATASALLLRTIGIPTRYAVGYSVHEFSQLENQYIVRSRHAHAWTMVYIDGKWQAFDTTPADWTTAENANASQWQFVSDLGSLLSFKLSGWMRSVTGSNEFKYGLWLILPLSFILMQRFGTKKSVRRLSRKQIVPTPTNKYKSVVINSEFYLVEKALNKLGFIRNPSESLKNWVKRLKAELPASSLIDELALLVELYYRDRFDPQGIKEAERAKLKSAVRSWLDKYGNSK